ncbi:hypothetical protein CLAFUW4_14644 [Fulvia fulva]|uniref:Uncharacterized protein n=1 Tax=Passalora fulva TaxID=5499 RepID=A0A9Q8UWI4_PASFU|nr:uncharacterized protein CLAFUR5_14472 [Fulvia fulva]KAK4609373.1 hypothetical protein CLAFUR4_14638 [Fulvia fulva]KAK4609551.1 hypothetical protein CLAFUR0_14637 [Fulvia fulva]UJO24942.1 hypothetical protein CLAFUR5_14472 [Fulvia fulva]WPV22680.1 hypothetical protein CLAFUW4_14644 [Fulvia fulva]WPV37769.1 hypothetical protein CLAFUW7_14647 [Fulvia fulva]
MDEYMASNGFSNELKRSLSTPNLQKQREDHQPRGDPNLTVKSPPTLLSEEKVQWVNDLHEDIHILKPLLDEIITGQRKILQELGIKSQHAESIPRGSTPWPHGRMAAIDAATMVKWDEVQSTRRMLEPMLKEIRGAGGSDEQYWAAAGLWEAVLGWSMRG